MSICSPRVHTCSCCLCSIRYAIISHTRHIYICIWMCFNVPLPSLHLTYSLLVHRLFWAIYGSRYISHNDRYMHVTWYRHIVIICMEHDQYTWYKYCECWGHVYVYMSSFTRHDAIQWRFLIFLIYVLLTSSRSPGVVLKPTAASRWHWAGTVVIAALYVRSPRALFTYHVSLEWSLVRA